MNNSLTIKELAKRIEPNAKTIILCHKNPDPDTLGSAFALRHILRHFGSECDVGCCDLTQRKFDFITGGRSLEYKDSGYERYIAVDVASPSQLGELEYLSDRVDITIDHHAMCTRFSDYYENLRASCAENIYLLAKELDILDKLPLNFFECLYAGMSADTGGFRFSNVTPDTMSLASLVIASGIDHAEINRVIFDSKSLEEIKAQRLTYENMEMYLDGAISLIIFTNEMKNANGIVDADIGDIVNSVRGIDGVLVALSLKQNSRDETKYSLSSRANANIDVSKGCMLLGGGGHTRAAGATVIASSPEEARKIALPIFEKLVLEYKAGLENE